MILGPAEILVILVVALIVFGPKRLPEVGRQVGAAMRELRKMQDTVRAELDRVLHPDFTPAPTDARRSRRRSKTSTTPCRFRARSRADAELRRRVQRPARLVHLSGTRDHERGSTMNEQINEDDAAR